MDMMTIIGLIVAVFATLFGIFGGFLPGGSPAVFFNAASVSVVIGGTAGALMLMFPARTFADIPSMLGKAFRDRRPGPQVYIDHIVDMADVARRNNLLALDEKAEGYGDPFLRRAVILAMDTPEPYRIRAMLEDETAATAERHKNGVRFFEKGAAAAAGFGMAGTLAGLINLIAGMDAGTDAIAAAMISALLPAFYGIIIANAVFLPVAGKLRIRGEEEMLCRLIVTEGIIDIADAKNPKQIREKLNTYIPPKLRGTEGNSPQA